MEKQATKVTDFFLQLQKRSPVVFDLYRGQLRRKWVITTGAEHKTVDDSTDSSQDALKIQQVIQNYHV